MFLQNISINVEQKHIDGGERDHGTKCAIALAIREMVDSDTDLEVDGTGIKIGYEYFDIPEEVKEFIDRFDKGEPVEPISFEARFRSTVGEETEW